MKIHVVTLFPHLISSYFNTSIMARACKSGLIQVNIVNIRDFATDKHKTCDDEPYGGGYGMLLKTEPLAMALDSVASPILKRQGHLAYTIYPSPVAPLFTQQDAYELSQKQELVFICGKYEGIDQRIIDMYVDKVYSIGEYVLSSGEIAVMTILDASVRLMEGVIRKESLNDESYEDSLLEYPQYTRPAIFRGISVPEILLSGNHKKIAEWRQEQKIKQTKKHRPDLLVRKR